MVNDPIKIWLPGRLPDFNEMIDDAKERSGNYNAYAQKKLFAENDRLFWLKSNYRHIPRPIRYQVHIEFTWVEYDKRRDPDNICAAKKIVLDTFRLAKILKDDGWQQVAGFCDHFEINKKNPGVWVCLHEARKV